MEDQSRPEFEKLIDKVAGTSAWIGRARYGNSIVAPESVCVFSSISVMGGLGEVMSFPGLNATIRRQRQNMLANP
jgi:hypothetical protein